MAQLLGTSINGTLNVTGAANFTGKVTHKLNDSGFVIGNDTYSAALLMGSGVNRGLWDYTLNKWIVYADATNVYLKGNADTATIADVANRIGSSSIGSTSKPIYINGGTPTALSATVGSSYIPVYLNAGTITAAQNLHCTTTYGGTFTPKTGVNVSTDSAYYYSYYSPATKIGILRMYVKYTPTSNVAVRNLVELGTLGSPNADGVTVGSVYRAVTGVGAVGTCYINDGGTVGMRLNVALTANTTYAVYLNLCYVSD